MESWANTRARGVPYSTPSAVGRHVLTLDNSVGIPQYPPARGASRPLFYPLWTTVYSHPFQGPLSGRPQPWATLSSVGSSTESMPSSEPSSRPGPLTSIPVPYSGIDPQLLGFWLLSGTRVGIRTCDLSIKGSNPLPTWLWRAGLEVGGGYYKAKRNRVRHSWHSYGPVGTVGSALIFFPPFHYT